MNTGFRKSFLNDIKKIKDEALLEKIEQVILSVENAETMQDIPHLKKLKGSKEGKYYRIKIGNYRVGVVIEDETATFVVFDDRKNIYKYFP